MNRPPLWTLYLVPLLVMAFAFGLRAAAQDRPLGSLLEASTTPTEARVLFQADGGCQVVAVGVVATDLGDQQVFTGAPFKMNGARCANLQDRALAAVKLAAGVGDGGAP